MPQRVADACRLYPCDLLFVHRDAELAAHVDRVAEIRKALDAAGTRIPHVCIVPVRMAEAWLLHDERAIRKAASNPNGRAALQLPAPGRAESEADPKARLREALLSAAEVTGRRRKRLQRDFGVMRLRVAELIEDFSPLRQLPAFQAFERELREVLAAL